MKPFSTFFLFIIWMAPVMLVGQQTVKLTKAVGDNAGREIYYVLKSDKSVMHGSYEQFDRSGILQVSGFYKNGLKDSTWTYYGSNGKKKKMRGDFFQDARTGVWKFYDSNGTLEQSYNYSTHELVYDVIIEKDADKEYNLVTDTGIVKLKLDRPAIYLGGTEPIYEVLNEHLQYPQMAKEKGIQGKVWISFIVDEHGKTSGHKIVGEVGGGCDEEALRVVKLIPDNWLPALLDGRPVTMEYFYPINFVLH